MKTTHEHRKYTASRDRCYSGGARDQRAAGGVTWDETCRCGATRTVHSNAGHVDVGEWNAVEDED